MDKKILVVEDDIKACEILAAILRHRGYVVVTAKDGQEGLETWLREADLIVLVISDHDMPRLNGSEMIKTARSLQLRAATIIFSGIERDCIPETICLKKVTDLPMLFDIVTDIMSQSAA
jgi:CheY-like chemotaxis protein